MSRNPRPKPEPTKCEWKPSDQLRAKIALETKRRDEEMLDVMIKAFFGDTQLVLIPLEDLKPGHKFYLNATLATVTIASPEGVTVHLNLGLGDDPELITPSGIHRDALLKLYPDGIPVLWEPKVITGEMEMTALNVPLGLTVGDGSGLLREVLAREGALPGERYRVTFEQLPGVGE